MTNKGGPSLSHAPLADSESSQQLPVTTVDARGLLCPLPLLKLRQALRHCKTGELVSIITTDPGSQKDIPSYLRQSSHELVQQRTMANQDHEILIRCGKQEA